MPCVCTVLPPSPGDIVQITAMVFRSNEIVIQINGGGKKHFHLRDHLQVGVGNVSTPAPVYAPPSSAWFHNRS